MRSRRYSHDRRPARSPVAVTLALLTLPLAAPGPALAQQPDMAAATAALEWREIGPTIMGGRVADLAVVESDPSTFYVATASGGVWKTENGGTSFESLFDDQPTASIGDVTVAPSNPNVVWVGSGEPQNRQSSPWGMGVFRSTDAGRTWRHLGLEDTHHIARIVVHPRDPDIAYVAAVGHLWGANPERGVYRTTDGGRTWEHVLFIDDDTGAIDLAMDPGDPQTVFAAMYQRRRTLWGFNGGGPGSGIHRTTDGGASWEELAGGLPEGDKGRIGLDIYRGDGNIVYALVEADARRPDQGFGGGGGQGEVRNGVYRSTDRGETWEHLSTTNNRPMYYSQIRIDPTDPERIYLGGADLFMSSDGGRTFTDEAAAEVHLDHHALWIDPSDSDHLIVAGDGGVSVSWDRSRTWRQLRNLPIAQFYEIGVDNREPYHVCGGLQDNGSWCAPSNTWSSMGIRTRHWYNVSGGDGFFTVMHPTLPIMFSESQNGNLRRVDLRTMESVRMRPVGRPSTGEDGEEVEPDYRFNWNSPVVLSKHDANTVYYGGERVFRSTDLGTTWEELSGDLTKGIDRSTLEIMGVPGTEPMMSRHDGTSTFGNLVALAESPVDARVLYAGSEDGNLHVTRDGGATWTNVAPAMPGLPEQTYITRIVASHADAGTVWAAGDNHRNDDFAPYVYVSNDYGASWRRITTGLPGGWSVNALAQHPRAANVLFAGNEIGVYFSIDAGATWHPLRNNLPTVPVDDIVVHPRDNDLVIGTHGRGIWIMDDITPIERLTPQVMASAARVFPVRPAIAYNEYGPQEWTPGIWQAENPPQGGRIRYYLRDAVPAAATTAQGAADGMGSTASRSASGPRADGSRPSRQEAPAGVTISIVDADGRVVRELEGGGGAGLNEVIWDLRHEDAYESEGDGGGGGFFGGGGARGPRVLPGTYTARLPVPGEGAAETTSVEVRLDPRVEISREDLMARQDALMRSFALARPVYEAGQAVGRLRRQIADVRRQLGEHDDAPEALSDEVDAISEELDDVNEALGDARQGAGARGQIEGAHVRPTADQLWTIERGWEKVPGAIERLNAVITDRMPALYRAMGEAGIRPDAGEPVEVPVPPVG